VLRIKPKDEPVLFDGLRYQRMLELRYMDSL
jgi:hypothetical protein